MKERHKHGLKPGKAGNQQKKSAGGKTTYDDQKMKSTDIANAHASGIGALGRSDENQIEKLNDDEIGDDDNVY